MFDTVCVCMSTCVSCVYVRAYVRARPCTCVCACVCACTQARCDAHNSTIAQPHDFFWITSLSYIYSTDTQCDSSFISNNADVCAYAIKNRSDQSILPTSGVIHYRDQLKASGRPDLPVLILETGWRLPNTTENAISMISAYTDEWLPDPRMESVMPFLLSADPLNTIFNPKLIWVEWDNATSTPTFTLEYNLTKRFRCSLGVGGAC